MNFVNWPQIFTRINGAILLLFLSVSGYGQITCGYHFTKDSIGCAPLTILAAADVTSASPVTQYAWVLVDNLTGQSVFSPPPGANNTFSYIQPKPGTYCLRLTATNQQGQSCAVNNRCDIVVADTPTVNITFSLTESCFPLVTTVSCQSTPGCGTIDSIKVDWGCGGLNVYQQGCFTPFSRTFGCPAGTTSSPTVVAYNSCGCTGTKTYTDLVNVINKPKANFTADVSNVLCATTPLVSNFTADSAGPNITYCWYVDNVLQQCSTSRFFSHTFPVSPLCYDVKLTVAHVTGGSCIDSIVKVGYICNRPKPVIGFFQNIDTACINANTTATLTLTNDPADGLTALTWILTKPDNTNYPTVVSDVANFTISQPGVYNLIVSGSFGPGCVDADTLPVLVAFTRPTANFTVDDNFGCKPGFAPTFTASGCATCSYTWEFLGAQPQNMTGAVASPTYNSFGNFQVTLRATSPEGCTDVVTKNNFISVAKISPVISLNRRKGCAPLCVTFTNATPIATFPEPIASSCWTFRGPPGAILPVGTCKDTSLCLTAPGCYTPMLTMTTTTGCIDSTKLSGPDSLCVGVAPVCTLTASDTLVCYRDTVTFSLTCNIQPNLVKFNAGDGSGMLPYYTRTWVHVYDKDTGSFQAIAIPFSDSCSSDTFRITVHVLPPAAKFTTASACSTGDTVFLTNKSKGATGYLWRFCDGTTSTDSNVARVFPPCDSCQITLETSHTNGCTDSYDTLIRTPCASVGFLPRNGSGCAPLSMRFTNTSASINTNPVNVTRWSWTCPPNFGLSSTPGVVVNRNFNQPGLYCIAMQNISASGCIDTVIGSVKVCGLKANFGPTSVCLPRDICFIDSSSKIGCDSVSYFWNFGDGSPISNDTAPCHTYSNPNTYTVTLVIRSHLGCVDSIKKQVIAATPVTLNYTIDTLICPGKTQCIVNNSVGAPGVPLIWQWQMPGATPNNSSQPAPCFSYNSPGDYPVYVTIRSGAQCTVFDSAIVHNRAPLAGGYASTDTLSCPNPPTIIQFTDTSQFVDNTWRWNFGDGSFSNVAQAVNIYTYPGEYPVSLEVTTKDGCTDTTIIDTIVVQGPYGDFGFAPPGMCACKDTIYFSVSTVFASRLSLLYGCNQGFVQNSNINPIGTPGNPTVLDFQWPYCITGLCQPQLEFGDVTGCRVFKDQPYIPIDSPVIGFKINNYGVCLKGTVCFEDTTTYTLDTPYSYTVFRWWDFGDPASGASNYDSSNTTTPCHYYNQPGGYQAKLYIRSNLGCYDSLITSIVVVPEYPVAHFYPDDSLVCAYTPMCFHDTSEIYPLTGPDYWVVDFGDNNIDTFNTPDFCHTYEAGGYYRVSMCVYDSVGCPDCDSSVIIRVIDNPVADAGGDRNICYGVPTQVTGTGGLGAQWSPSALFSDPAIYNPMVQIYTDTVITFRVYDQYLCADTDTVALRVAQVLADFSSGTTYCREDTVCVIDASTSINGTLVNWIYDFGNTDIDTSNTPNYCYVYRPGNFGPYTITLTAIDDNGCMDTATWDIGIFPSPDAVFTLTDTSLCSDQPLCVNDASTSQAPITTWVWNYGDNSPTVSGQQQPCRSYSPPFQASYNVSLAITNQNGCTDTAIIPVIMKLKPTANFDPQPACEIDSINFASTSIQGTDAIINCEWTFWVGAPNPVIDTNCNTGFRFPAGNYPVQLKVTDINTCTDSITKNILSDSSAVLTISPGDTSICLGSSVEYTVAGVFDNITWSPNVWISDPNSPVVTINPLANISYIVNVVNGVCDAVSDTFAIRTIQPVPITCEATPIEVVLGLQSNLNATAPGRIDSIIWTPDATLDCRDCPNPIALPTQTTTYRATIYFSENGTVCTNSCDLTINVLNVCDNSVIYLPNTFTPNADGVNDVFMIRGLAATKINHLRVFDRWGRMVFNAETGVPNEPHWGWDGTDNTGKQLNTGVYVYTYEIECINGDIVTGNGNITLVR